MITTEDLIADWIAIRTTLKRQLEHLKSRSICHTQTFADGALNSQPDDSLARADHSCQARQELSEDGPSRRKISACAHDRLR
jgi:hypothetical protein